MDCRPRSILIFKYADRVDEYVLSGGSLVMISRTAYSYDADTGNLTREENYYGSDLNAPYRTTISEYVTNTDPSVWILNTLSSRTVQNTNGGVLSEQQYGYDGNLPGVGSPTTPKPILSRVVSGTQTIDTKYRYDSYGNVYETDQYKNYGTTSGQPSGDFASYLTDYDPALKTYAISSDPPLLPATTTEYDYGLGLPITVTDPNNNATTATYDGLGRTTSVTYQGYAQANVKYTYPTPSGSPLAVSAPFALKMEMWDETVSQYRASWQIMDGLGRVIQTQGPYEIAGMLVLTDTSYNAQGLPLYQGLPRTITGTGGGYSAPSWGSVQHTTTSYDALGRTISVAYPDGTSETISYSGLRTTFVDRNNHNRVQENDAFSRLVKVEEYTGSNPYTLYATTQYTYDERDLLKQVMDAAGNLTVINYDGFGRKIDMTDPDLGNWRYRYDPSGNLSAQIDAKRQAVNLYYDDLNRLIGKTYTTGPVNADTYQRPVDPGYTGYSIKDSYDQGTNGYGRRTRLEDPSGYTVWSYNALGQVISGTQNIDGTSYNSSGTYDAFGRPLTQVLPSTEALSYTYNAMGSLVGLSGTSTYVSQIHYNASGQVTDQLLGNGLRQQSCYNASNLRLASLSVYPGALQTCIASPSNSLLSLSYSYEANGNISQIVDATRSETLNSTYDELDRLLSASGTENRNYAYNSIGNMTSRNTAQPNPGTNGLVSWWKMDETSGTRTDSNGANHLADNNTVGSTTGKQGNASLFVMANSEYLSIQDNPSVSMGNGARMAVCTWVKLNSKSLTGVQNFVTKRGATNGTWEYFLRYDGRVDRFVYLASADGYAATTAEVKANTFASQSGSPVIGTWYFVCGGNDGLNAWISINAGTRDTVPFTTGIYDGPNMLRIGSGYNAEYLDGALDEMALYKRSLTQAEVEWLYNSGSGRTYADLSLPTPGATTFSYGDPAHKHAVTSLSTGKSYTYDANGNMTCRVEGGNTYKQDYNIENMLIAVRKMSGGCAGTVLETTSFVYDGDGNLVKKVNPDGSRTLYIGDVYEVDKNAAGTVTGTKTYYPAGGAMRVNGTVYYTSKTTWVRPAL